MIRLGFSVGFEGFRRVTSKGISNFFFGGGGGGGGEGGGIFQGGGL